MVFGSVGFFMLALTMLAVFGTPGNRLHEAIADQSFFVIISVILFYIGTPVAEKWVESRNRAA
jgi:hypothetical protein